MATDFLFSLLLFGCNAAYSSVSTHTANKRIRQSEAYLRREGYNPQRQFQLEIKRHKELEELIGYSFPDDVRENEKVAAAILQREGYKWFDRRKVERTDPYYRMYAGIKTRPGDVTFQDLKEIERAKRMPAPGSEEEKAYQDRQFKVYICVAWAIFLVLVLLCVILYRP